MTTTRTLLLGNGLNRLINDSISWSKVLVDGETESINELLRAGVPLTLLFEGIAAFRGTQTFSKKKADFNEIKRDKVKKLVGSLTPPDETLYAAASLPYNYIITTNYDTRFENCFSSYKARKGIGSGTRYLLEPTGSAEGKLFFHAHGIADRINSVCMGYEHYQKMNVRIAAELGINKADNESNDYAALARRLSSPVSEEEIVWPLLVLGSKVDVVGFGMSFDETDFWWLLTLRAALQGQYPDLPFSSIKYYYIDINQDKNYETHRIIKALEMLHVACRRVAAVDYPEGYASIIKMIREDL